MEQRVLTLQSFPIMNLALSRTWFGRNQSNKWRNVVPEVNTRIYVREIRLASLRESFFLMYSFCSKDVFAK